ncbi:GNAT family N-acetyltransferase [Tumebacillus avium]|uniref:GNAT family N-acetyltransferase n=1 Tax=Tumebacillus avium TaxID=1903704 RepID=UPI0012FDB44E|nr:GNAT family N-acetyltransferase [Tumebacillus avium]
MGGSTLLREPTNPASIYYNRVKGFGAQDVPLLDTILNHYPDGAPCFDLTPDLLSPDVSRALIEKGYLPAEQLVFLHADPLQKFEGTYEFQFELVTEETAEKFIQWIALSNGGMELTEEMVARSKPYFYRPDFKNYMLTIDGNPAAMGSMFVHGQAGYLANDFTFPEYRGRGCQTALLRHRLAEAVQLGLDTLYTDVEFGSVSHANMERAGFRTAYLSAFWIKDDK